MKGITILILIVPLLGLLALGSAIKASPPKLPEPTRGQTDGALCFGSVVFLAFVGAVVFPRLWDDTMSMFTGWDTPMPIQAMPSFWNRHKEVEWDCGDEGSVIGYRYLYVKRDKATVEFTSGAMGTLKENPVLKRNRGSWRGAFNISDRIPTMTNKSGIYAAKTPDSPVLSQYREPDTILVKLRLSGRIVEAEYGYRAHRADILEIIEHIPPEECS